MKKSIKLDVNTISNTMRNKFGKKYRSLGEVSIFGCGIGESIE